MLVPTIDWCIKNKHKYVCTHTSTHKYHNRSTCCHDVSVDVCVCTCNDGETDTASDSPLQCLQTRDKTPYVASNTSLLHDLRLKTRQQPKEYFQHCAKKSHLQSLPKDFDKRARPVCPAAWLTQLWLIPLLKDSTTSSYIINCTCVCLTAKWMTAHRLEVYASMIGAWISQQGTNPHPL